MKAAVLYGKEELKIVPDFDDPVIKDSDVLINSKYTGLCSTDRTLYRGYVPFKPPLIIGHEIAGVVEEVGHPRIYHFFNSRVYLDSFCFGNFRTFTYYPMSNRLQTVGYDFITFNLENRG